jgi:Kae1-associated kinase Bud32
MKEIARGAEAVLFRDNSRLVKDRVKKGYRIPELDTRIRKLRTRGEERLLDRARRAGVNTPRVLDSGESSLVMEFIEGRRVKDALNGMPKGERVRVYRLIGEAVAGLHSAGIMHGDLTTSNMILRQEKLYIIDFGLGRMSERIEDQAVDLFLLFEALKSTHFEYLNEAWQYILKVYKQDYKRAGEALLRLGKIGKRRRYKK